MRAAFPAWLLLAACAAPDTEFDRIVLVTLDTTRADHLGAYGYPRATSPFLDSLAARGVLFERAIAPLPMTVPSHATMFTSLHPLEHGVRHNGLVLPEGIPTLAELLRERGYATAAFVSLDVLARSGLERGFDRVVFRDLEDKVFGLPFEKSASATTRDAARWFRRRQPTDRFFLWVHYFEPHHPYAPSGPTRSSVRTQSVGVEAIRDELIGAHGIRLDLYDGDVARMLDTVDRYDGELRTVDDQLRRLYRAFEKHGLADDSVWIVVGDHGEGLGSHDWMGHSVRIYEEQVRVPLVVHAPEGRWTPRRVEEIVELADLLPTVAAFAGAPTPPGTHGRSLLPQLTGGGTIGRDREALVQAHSFEPWAESPAAASRGPSSPLWAVGDRLGLLGQRWKYVVTNAEPEALYDLSSDPTESHNVAEAQPEIAGAMHARLMRRTRELWARRRTAAPADAETLEVLRAMGYLR